MTSASPFLNYLPVPAYFSFAHCLFIVYVLFFSLRNLSHLTQDTPDYYFFCTLQQCSLWHKTTTATPVHTIEINVCSLDFKEKTGFRRYCLQQDELIMKQIDMEPPRDRELVLKDRHSFSEMSNRPAIPMWDSADPERAPPPLPLNPGPGSPTTRPNASASIQAVAAALSERSNENVPSSYTVNPMPLKSSPEKSLVKGQFHKRIQSLQPATNSRELTTYTERRSPDRNPRASPFDADGGRTREKSPTRVKTPTSAGKDPSNFRASSRYLSKPILGENTPPSATMLALQNMHLPIEIESPTRGASNNTSPQQPQDLGSLSAQISSLTSIATALQQEMAQLSRRSKDNATDLVSLKAATNARDEDIRRSLKDLATNLTGKLLENETSRSTASYIHSGSSGFMLDSKAHDATSPCSRKSYTIPRMQSPSSFAAAIERELAASPSISTDGSASIALLEKVLREMATKEGQEKLLKLMDEVKSRPSGGQNSDNAMSQMLEEILNLVKQNSNNHALVRARHVPDSQNSPSLELGYETPRSGPLSRNAETETPIQNQNQSLENGSPTQATDALSEEILTILKKVKSSVADGGGLTNEVKALVRELRGEVLGMGREIARKLEEADAGRASEQEIPPGARAEEVAHIVNGALADLRVHMEQIISDTQRQLSSRIPRVVDGQEVYMAVKKALEDHPLPEPAPPQITGSVLEREEILEAVREAWETYKPEIELQNFGLERDEILECLTEGLKAYQPPKEPAEPDITYSEVLEAVQQGLENFTLPLMEPDGAITREEITATIRDCLESFEWPVPPAVLDREAAINRDDVLNAVKEGLATRDNFSKEIEFNRDDITEAVKAGIDEVSGLLHNNVSDQFLDQLHSLLGEMKDEFKQYSATNGRDTEQVLDAIKDGLEALRGEIESYVDRASDVTGKDEIIHTVKDGFHLLQSDLEKSIAEAARVSDGGHSNTVELLDAMEKEFEHLRQTMSNLLIRNSVSSEKDEILDAIRDIAEGDRSKDNGSEISQMVKEEFEHLRETLTLMIMKPNSSLERDELVSILRESFEAIQDENSRRKDGNESVISNTGELLDAFHDGIDILRSDLEKIMNRPADTSEEFLDSLRDGLAGVRAEIEQLRHDQKEAEETQTIRGQEVMLASESSIGSDIESLKVLVTQLQIKVEAIEPRPADSENEANIVKKDDLIDVLNSIKEVQELVVEVASREPPAAVVDENAAKKEDTDAIETLLVNMKAKVDELAETGGSHGMTTERADALEALTKETKDILDGFAAHVETHGASKSELENLETIVKDIWVAVEEMKTNSAPPEDASEKVLKEDVRTLEAMLLGIKSQLEDFVLPDIETLPTKDDIGAVYHMVTEFKEKVEVENDLTAQAFESRKIEHGGLAEKIDEAKQLIIDLKDELKSKLTNSEEGLVDMKTILEALSDSSESFATAESLKELSDLITREFDRSHGDREAEKMETAERETAMSTKQEEARAAIVLDLGTKIDEKFSELLSKYEDAQMLVDSKFTAIEERDVQSLDTLTSTKNIAEDLKLVIGGMGDSVTQACERMSDDAKTFFDRVDQSFSKVDDLRADVQSQHDHLKGEFARALEATDRLESQLANSHPEILSTINDILSIVGQHYEHSQKTSEELKLNVSAIPSAIPPLLPALPPPPPPPEPREIVVPEKYDDTELQGKLNSLLDHASSDKSMSQIEKLDKIQDQITSAANELREMMLAQSALLIQDCERKNKEAEEVAIALEKRLAQKERVEADVVELNEEKESLFLMVQALKEEKEMLSKQNMKLHKEVAGLETALRIRREEMQLMEERAEGLERRIVEGVLDHARSLLISRPGSTQALNLKRVPSSASTVTRGSVASATNPSSVLTSGVGMALKRRRNPLKTNAGSTAPSNTKQERRILSLSNVTGNQKSMDRQMLPAARGRLTNLKRSHSVKSSYPIRKPSWDSRGFTANKENEVVKEEDEECGDDESDTGTERRTSYTGTCTDSMSYATGSTLSTTDRQSSYSSSTNGLVAAEPGTWVEESESGSEDDQSLGEDGDGLRGLGTKSVASTEPLESQPRDDESSVDPGGMVVYAQASDSGLGTDLPSVVNEKEFEFRQESIYGECD
ncbi:hypothetical protein BDDG_06384 [Blastomyces dermatitidis ATCC 18188]|uniref:Chromosome segregation ATPase family protein n=1 Tax=Ajellomyces dermatitidis (strain ATCC 18188 / CBS 674.68) TaxID=653446 RepID=F2TJM7_AJEDA|nr:hypothetical protein BDDG_06384 [Blastomyces dermatitidis ATCC 18188]